MGPFIVDMILHLQKDRRNNKPIANVIINVRLAHLCKILLYITALHCIQACYKVKYHEPSLNLFCRSTWLHCGVKY